MLFAERHGKLGRDGSLAHDRAEDLLTSTAFQLLRYMPPHDGLFAVLRCSRAVTWDGARAEATRKAHDVLMSKLDRATSYELEFWPHWGVGVGQPELIITLKANDKSLGRLLVEVKLDSGKSQLAEGDPETDAPEPRDPDQLSRYYRYLAKVTTCEVPALGLIYLTAHATPPLDDLTESLARQRQPCDWLSWLSWRDVFTEMRRAANWYLPARDLAEILAAKGLKDFEGIHTTSWVPPPKPWQFWTQPVAHWFTTSPIDLPVKAQFWTN